LLNSGSLSGSVISNLTDTYDGVPEVDYIITLSSASYAELVASASVDVNTLYVISDQGTVTDTSFNAYTASQEALNTTFATTGSNTFEGEQTINGTFTASLEEGYAWVGDSTGTTVAVATSSFGGGGGSTEGLATTGSNTFEGNQTINGEVEVRGTTGAAKLIVGNSNNDVVHTIEISQFSGQSSLPNPQENLFKFAVSGSSLTDRSVWFSNGYNWMRMTLTPNPVESLTFTTQPFVVIKTGAPFGLGNSAPMTGGGQCSPQLRILDSMGNPIFNETGSVSLSIGGPDSGSGELTGSLTEVVNDEGRVSFGTIGIDTAGTYNITASYEGGLQVESNSIYVVDNATAIGFTNQPPSSVVVGNSFSVNVGWDHPSGSLGGVATIEPITLTLTGPDSGSGTLSGDTTLNTNGCDLTVNFNGLSIAGTGTYTITATGDVSSLTVESTEITVTAE
jgi:hypothetical protein